MNDLLESARTFGLGVVLSMAILSMAWYLLKKTFDNHQIERDIWIRMAESHFRAQEVAHNYQREEHKEILLSLRGLNGK